MTPKLIIVELMIAQRNGAKFHKITIAKTGVLASKPSLEIRIDKA